MFGTHDRPFFVVTALVLNAAPGVDLTRRLGVRPATQRALKLLTAARFAALAARLAVVQR